MRQEDVPEVWSNRAWLAASRNAEKLGIRMHGGEMGNLIDAALAAVAPLIAKAERERCAELADVGNSMAQSPGAKRTASSIAAAIRALGDADG